MIETDIKFGSDLLGHQWIIYLRVVYPSLYLQEWLKDHRREPCHTDRHQRRGPQSSTQYCRCNDRFLARRRTDRRVSSRISRRRLVAARAMPLSRPASPARRDCARHGESVTLVIVIVFPAGPSQARPFSWGFGLIGKGLGGRVARPRPRAATRFVCRRRRCRFLNAPHPPAPIPPGLSGAPLSIAGVAAQIPVRCAARPNSARAVRYAVVNLVWLIPLRRIGGIYGEARPGVASKRRESPDKIGLRSHPQKKNWAGLIPPLIPPEIHRRPGRQCGLIEALGTRRGSSVMLTTAERLPGKNLGDYAAQETCLLDTCGVGQ